MLRKVTLGLIAAASLGAAALAPSAASAHGFHGGWGHHGWGYGGFGFGGVYVNTGISDCYRQRMVQTRHGLRLRTVNVCVYNTY
jgi:Spy/CpxP family protein refolding chaperone